jgi:hypothetical protein
MEFSGVKQSDEIKDWSNDDVAQNWKIDNFYIPKSRTETFRSSFIWKFISATTKLWNNSLPEQCTVEYTVQEMFIKPNKSLNCIILGTII